MTAWGAWALLGIGIGILFKFITHRPGARGWLAGICVGVAGSLTGGWIAADVWNQGVLNTRVANLGGAVIGGVVLLALYWYRLRRRASATQTVNPNAM
jgi:uncharacterized membrane protein YeaQ/YmgE (transglycosylase-associated protein family)